LDYSGKLKDGHNVELGYFAQNQDEIMDGSLTVLDTVDKIAVGDVRTKIRDILGAFLFSGEDVDKKVRVLSGGERSRLAMACMLLQPFNLLILDEPTNHLDMRSKDILKQALLSFDGTLILVSHDRDFLDGLVDKVFEFRHKKVKEHLGGIYDFLQSRKLSNLKEIERKGPSAPGQKNGKASKQKNGQKTGQNSQGSGQNLKGSGPKSQGSGPKSQGSGKGPLMEEESASSSNKLQYEERKALDKKIRKISNRVKALETEIAKLEEELKGMDEMLMNPDNISGMQVYEEYEQLKIRLDEAMNNWEKQTSALEKSESRRK
jgi:ATP-binding cassette, subfamily F, member 3